MAKRKSRNTSPISGEERVLSKVEILSQKLPIQKIYVEEWGGFVHVKAMSAREVQQNAQFIMTKKGDTDMAKAVRVPARVCARQIVDENGTPIFSERDIQELEELHNSAIKYISEQVSILSGQEVEVGDAEQELAELTEYLEEKYPGLLRDYRREKSPVGQAEENFNETPSADLPSD